jgi:hypothetical protein
MSSGYRLQRSIPPEQRILHGTPGSIYLLENNGLRPGIYRIGATRRSGVSKAMEFNRDNQHMIPGQYECVFELHTKDCGLAMEKIRDHFRHQRCGNRYLDFYELDLDAAIDTITSFIADINAKAYQRSIQIQTPVPELMRHLEPDPVPAEVRTFSPPPVSLFRKAFEWVAS